MTKPCLIAIAGASGSGKSWLANYLVGQLAATVVPLDCYYRDLTHLELDSRARQNFDAPEALDWDLILNNLRALAQGRDVQRPIYDFATHSRTSRLETVRAAGFIIVEGLFALYQEPVRELCGIKVFVWVDDEVCLMRRIDRDTRERGRTADSVLSQYRETVRPMYDKYVLPTEAFADLVLCGQDPVEKLAASVIGQVGRQLGRSRASKPASRARF